MKNDPRLSGDDTGNEGNLKIISNKIIEDTRLKEYLFKRQIPLIPSKVALRPHGRTIVFPDGNFREAGFI